MDTRRASWLLVLGLTALVVTGCQYGGVRYVDEAGNPLACDADGNLILPARFVDSGAPMASAVTMDDAPMTASADIPVPTSAGEPVIVTDVTEPAADEIPATPPAPEPTPTEPAAIASFPSFPTLPEGVRAVPSPMEPAAMPVDLPPTGQSAGFPAMPSNFDLPSKPRKAKPVDCSSALDRPPAG